MVPGRVERFAGRQVQAHPLVLLGASPFVVMVRASRAAGPASRVSEGRTRIRQNGPRGLVDRGRTVIPPQFAFAQDLRAGLAQVRFDNGRMGSVSPDGTVVWPPDVR